MSHKNQISDSAVRWDLLFFAQLSEKTRKSNCLQMFLQRQQFLLSYLKILIVGPAGFEPAASRSADRRSPNRANQAELIQGCILLRKDNNFRPAEHFRWTNQSSCWAYIASTLHISLSIHTMQSPASNDSLCWLLCSDCR